MEESERAKSPAKRKQSGSVVNYNNSDEFKQQQERIAELEALLKQEQIKVLQLGKKLQQANKLLSSKAR